MKPGRFGIEEASNLGLKPGRFGADQDSNLGLKPGSQFPSTVIGILPLKK